MKYVPFADFNQITGLLFGRIWTSGRKGATAAYLSNIRDALEQLVARTGELLEEGSNGTLSEVSDAQKKFRDVVQLLHSRIEGALVDGISGAEAVLAIEALTEFQSLRSQYSESLKAQVSQEQSTLNQASGSAEYRRFVALKQLAEVRRERVEAYKRMIELRAKLHSTQKAISTLQHFSAIVEKEESEFSADLLADLESEVQRIFTTITSQPKLVPIIQIKTERGIRSAEILIENFHGLGTVPAREYLSEANRNALGLAIYFASILRHGPALESVILDDVSHSTDSEHRRGMAAFITGELSQVRQLLLFTHDKDWYRRLTNLFDGKYKGVKVTRWTPDGQTLETDKWSNLLDQASQRIQSLENTAGNDLRQAMEQFLDELCEVLNVEVPYRQTATEVKFEVKRQRLYSTIDSKWTTGAGIISPSDPALLAFKDSQKVANLSSHYGSYSEWDHQSLLDALADVEAFVRLFTCKGTHKGVICGGILPSLTKQSGNYPVCKRCKKPFVP
jgi:hypothetical protein